jgi:hypothetical protein
VAAGPGLVCRTWAGQDLRGAAGCRDSTGAGQGRARRASGFQFTAATCGDFTLYWWLDTVPAQTLASSGRFSTSFVCTWNVHIACYFSFARQYLPFHFAYWKFAYHLLICFAYFANRVHHAYHLHIILHTICSILHLSSTLNIAFHVVHIMHTILGIIL